MAGFARVMTIAALLVLTACSKEPSPPVTEGVTDALLANPPAGEWLNYGGDIGGQHYSSLNLINGGNIGELGLAWFADFDTDRGQEAIPLIHDGVLYLSTAWSMVKAYDARNGKLKWSYDPKVPKETLVRACCDAVNRGVALYGDKVYVATLDGRLVALEQATGKVVFEKVAVPNQRDYAITGAPRIANGLVLIGSGGAEFKARGFIGAFDAQTGEEIWRFHTTPGNPADGFESEAMEKAAKTWSGEWWKYGGGGTVWDAITFDPVTGLVYFGTGNAAPWSPAAAGREGDSLYTSSIVAVDARTGEYAWHYQETPEDRWDYDSASPIIVRDLTIEGKTRRVVIHAPKNGFFFLFDASSGELLSGTSYAPQNWTTGIDPKTGKPTITPEARYDVTGKPFSSLPGPMGAHSFHPMSYNPKTGLVYVPTNSGSSPFASDDDWQPTEVGYQSAQDPLLWALPSEIPEDGDAASISLGNGALIAWDPVSAREVWRTELPLLGNGGVLSTAGNLVFQGTTGGLFHAYSAETGKQLWSFDVQSGVVAAPMSYALDGDQYVAIVVGWGGSWGGAAIQSPATRNISRVLVFKLGAKNQLPPVIDLELAPIDPPPFTGTEKQVIAGARIYGRYCFACHGAYAVAGALYPDLRRSAMLEDPSAIEAIVLDGALKHDGMASFKAAIGKKDAEAIRQYLIKRANDSKVLGQ